jgi:hypothetical protein
MSNSLKLAVLSACAALLAANARALEERTVGATDFNYVGLAALSASAPPAQAPAAGLAFAKAAAPAPDTGEVTDENASYLLAQCAGKNILGFPKTKPDYDAFYARFSALLAREGLKISSARFDPEAGSVLSYDSPQGLVLRRFISDDLTRVGDATPMAEVAAALEAKGLPVAAEYSLALEGLKDYAIYYFTDDSTREEDETQLRVLKTDGDDIDYSILSGVDAVSKPVPWLLAYIGAELGYVSGAGKDAGDAQQKLQSRVDFLTQGGARIIGTRMDPVNWPDLPDYKFVFSIYFYR